jgi:hypothetical protein
MRGKVPEYAPFGDDELQGADLSLQDALVMAADDDSGEQVCGWREREGERGRESERERGREREREREREGGERERERERERAEELGRGFSSGTARTFQPKLRHQHEHSQLPRDQTRRREVASSHGRWWASVDEGGCWLVLLRVGDAKG